MQRPVGPPSQEVTNWLTLRVNSTIAALQLSTDEPTLKGRIDKREKCGTKKRMVHGRACARNRIETVLN